MKTQERVGIEFRSPDLPPQWATLALLMLALLATASFAQGPPAAKTGLVTVHGVVRNTASGEPLARALVRIEGDASTGALTDSEGRFEISNVPAGQQAFTVTKPGFRDRPYAGGGMLLNDAIGPPHNILVADPMPDVEFSLAPTCSIHGQIELSTGDPAQGIVVELLRRMVQNGRATWMIASEMKANSEGAYRFAGLADGVYAIHSEPAMDTESPADFSARIDSASGPRSGYAGTFYPGTRDLAGAAKISLSNGDQAQANFTLTLEPFHRISGRVVFPRGASGADAAPGFGIGVSVVDTAGRPLNYPSRYDPSTATFQLLAPDGAYTLSVRVQLRVPAGGSSRWDAMKEALTGAVDLSVSGQSISNVQIPLGALAGNQIQLTVRRSATPSPSVNRGGQIQIAAHQTGGAIADAMTEGMTTMFAQDLHPGTNPAAGLPAGSYWIQSYLSNGLCEQSFTAGGANLAREPLLIGLSGAAPPMELTLRDDCAKLQLLPPQSVASTLAVEEPMYTVYVVPDFDTSVDLPLVTLRPSLGAGFTLDGLTPGSYHVYTFSAPVLLEYRNPAVLANLHTPGQAVTLSPGSTSQLVVEAPEH